MGLKNWDESILCDTDFEPDYDFDFGSESKERSEWLAKFEASLEADREAMEAFELRVQDELEELLDAHEVLVSSVTPCERHKAKDRLIPLGKWWHAWKRGLWQKKETLRTHRNPKALREGKRKFYEQQRSARGHPVLTLAPQEGIRVYLREWTTHELV